MNRPTLNADEKRIFDAIADVDEEWSTKPRCAEKAGAQSCYRFHLASPWLDLIGPR